MAFTSLFVSAIEVIVFKVSFLVLVLQCEVPEEKEKIYIYVMKVYEYCVHTLLAVMTAIA